MKYHNIQIPRCFENLYRGELDKYRILVYYGGRGGGKTENISFYLALKAIKEKINIVIAREFKLYNRGSMVEVFKKHFDTLGYKTNGSVILSLNNGSNIFFMGASKETMDNIRGVNNVKYLWFEEAHNIEEEVLRTCIPSIRADDSQIIITLNPQRKDDYIYQEYILKDGGEYHKSIKINYNDNSLFPDVLERDRIRDFENKPRELYNHIWLGEPLEYNDFKVIDTSKIGFFDDTIPIRYDELFLSADTAFSKKENADYSVIGCLGKKGNDIHLLRVFRGRWEFNELLEILKNAYFWLQDSQKQNVSSVIIEKKASGISLIQELKRLTNFRIKEVTPKSDKFSRVVEVLEDFPRLKLPNSKNPINSWVESFLSELKMFRGDLTHEHDDQVDMITYALKFSKYDKPQWQDF